MAVIRLCFFQFYCTKDEIVHHVYSVRHRVVTASEREDGRWNLFKLLRRLCFVYLSRYRTHGLLESSQRETASKQRLIALSTPLHARIVRRIRERQEGQTMSTHI